MNEVFSDFSYNYFLITNNDAFNICFLLHTKACMVFSSLRTYEIIYVNNRKKHTGIRLRPSAEHLPPFTTLEQSVFACFNVCKVRIFHKK